MRARLILNFPFLLFFFRGIHRCLFFFWAKFSKQLRTLAHSIIVFKQKLNSGNDFFQIPNVTLIQRMQFSLFVSLSDFFLLRTGNFLHERNSCCSYQFSKSDCPRVKSKSSGFTYHFTCHTISLSSLQVSLHRQTFNIRCYIYYTNNILNVYLCIYLNKIVG